MDPDGLKFEYTGKATGKFNLYLYEDDIIFMFLYKKQFLLSYI